MAATTAPGSKRVETPGRRWRPALILLIAMGTAALATLAGAYQFALSPVAAPGTQSVPTDFEVKAGEGLGAVARTLERRGLIRSALALRAHARLQGLETRLKVGEYDLSPELSTPRIAEILASGRVRTHPIVIPEGIRANEIADRLALAGLVDREAFLQIVLDPASPERFAVEGPTLEGYLFPDTYRFAKGLAATQIASAMVERFHEVYDELRATMPESELSMRELVTLGSIVEKETGVPEERPLIASVFLNRMKRGMRLETDPTVIYGIEDFDGNLRRVHLDDAGNPYNTYQIPGLPPGPIASPGRASLQAVLEPADSPFLFFVSRNDGTHVFSKSYGEHARAVVHFQKQRRRR